MPFMPRAARTLLYSSLGCFLLSGCVALTVAGAAVSVGAGAVGLAADVAVGTVRLTGKAAGAAIDAMSDDKHDNSGLNIRYREPTAADRDKRRLAEEQAREYEAQQAREIQEAQAAQEDAARHLAPTPTDAAQTYPLPPAVPLP